MSNLIDLYQRGLALPQPWETEYGFTMGERVRLSRDARSRSIGRNHWEQIGTVVGHGMLYESVYVLWDGIKTKYAYAPEFLEHFDAAGPND